MDIDIGVPTYADLSLDELFSRADDLSIDFVEVVLEAPTFYPYDDDLRNQLRSRPAGIDLVLHLPFGGIDPGSPFAAVRSGALEELQRGIDLGDDVGARTCVIHADSAVTPAVWDRATVIDTVHDSVAELCSYADRYQVEIAFENVAGEFVTIREFPDIFEHTPASMTLDTGHARVSGLSDDEIAAFVETYAGRISHFHLNDTRGASDDHLPVGMGSTDFAAIFEALPDGWSGTATVEAISSDFRYVELGVERLREELFDPPSGR